MKKLYTILAIALLASCTPETITVDCGCGKVETKYQPSPQIKNFVYTYTCNGEKIYVVTQSDVKIGAEICR